MKKILFYCAVFICLFSCNNTTNKNAIEAAKGNIKVVESADLEMNAAIDKARQNFNQFDTAFKNGHFDTSQFSIKVRFLTDNGGEHIWANDLVYKDGYYYGIVDEDAEATDKVKKGDKVKITLDNLSDWMYNDKGVLRGGYTIKVLRNKMTDKERASFDSSFYLKIID
ncbi:MAG: DUF2314 domain-containing protein [Chitinophagaceae bacterium]